MKICFCSSFLSDEKSAIDNSKVKPSIATHQFNLNILEGLRNLTGENLNILNTENVASFPNHKKIFFKKKQFNQDQIGNYQSIGKVNFPIVKDFFETFNLYFELKKWVAEQHDTDLFICGYGRRLSHAVAINLIKRKNPTVQTCMILADLSGKAVSVKSQSGYIKQKMFNWLLDFQVRQSIKFDSFVLLTKYMADYLKIEDKPYTVIEGICSDELLIECDKQIGSEDKKIIAYTGILSKQYNVDVLLEAFKGLNSEYELWLFGDGELNNEIKQLAKVHSNIKFFGFLPNKEMRKKLCEVTFLINTRQNLEEYTKYSFPSKTIEYMSMGKPVLCYKLDGIPDEYDDYLIYIEDNSSERLKDKIIEVCDFSIEKINIIGKENLNFVKNNKNSSSQVKKMIKMFDEMKG